MNKRRLGLLLLLLVTIVAVRVLIQGWNPGATVERPRLSVRLDYSFDDVIYEELNEQGKPFIRLTTPHLVHDPETSQAIADQPRLWVQQEDRDWHISARSGLLERNSDILLLTGDVLIDSSEGQPPMRMEAEELRYYAQNRDIAATGAVRLQRDRAEATGIGLEGNLISGQYRLLHDVEIIIHAPGDR